VEDRLLAAIWYLARAVGRATTQETVLPFGAFTRRQGGASFAQRRATTMAIPSLA
jgi:hypothetical protein